MIGLPNDPHPRIRITHRVAYAICFAISAFVAIPFCSRSNADDLATRLTMLEERIERERVKENIPGLAIAVIKDDQVVFAKGFGHTNIKTKDPVTTDTIFGVGSTTKSFTATLVAMLAEEGKLSLDDPVTELLPSFQLRVETGDESVTLRDLLCHRSGYCRMGILSASETPCPARV